MLSCDKPKNHIEVEVTKYFSDKLHDPNSLEIVNIKEVKTIDLISEIKESLKTSKSLLENYEVSIKYNPNNKFVIESREKYLLEVEGFESDIEEINNGKVKNEIKYFEVYFSYRANNKMGALVLSNAVAKMFYNELAKDKYGSIYSIKDLD